MDLKTIALDNGLSTETFRDLELGLERNPVGDFIKLNPSEPLKLINYTIYLDKSLSKVCFKGNSNIEVLI